MLALKILFVGSEEIFEKVHMLVDKIDVLEAIYAFDEIEGAKDWNDLIKDGNSNPQASKNESQSVRGEII